MGTYYFNDASIPPYSDKAEAKSHLSNLLIGLASLDANSEQLSQFRISIDAWELVLGNELGNDFTLGSLATEFYDTKHHEEATYFESLMRVVPPDRDLDEDQVDAVLRLDPLSAHSDIPETFPSVQAADHTSRLCGVTSGTMVSLLTSDLWKYDQLGFCASEESFLFDHIAEAAHAPLIIARRRAEELAGITNSTLWKTREKLFPSLLFAPSVEKNLEKLATALLPLLLKRLISLNTMASEWKKSGTFPTKPLQLKPETEMTMKKYGTQRRFRSARGNLITFEDHVIVDGLHRIHVFKHTDSKELEIGYIGRHLSTMLYPT